MIYLDAAALVKLVHPERETADLAVWLASRAGEPRVTSALVEVEVPRAVNRAAQAETGAASRVLESVLRLDLDHDVRASASRVLPRELRSLDAIHLATALLLGPELQAFVTYDKRLLDAATAAGLPVASPGT